MVEAVSKLKQCVYPSKQKGKEAKLVFNNAVEELIQSAEHELMYLTMTNPRDQTIVKKATIQLGEGMKGIL